MMECIAHRGMAGVTLGNEVFIDLDFADDIALLGEMLEVLVLAITIKHEEAAVFDLQKNWSKTKILKVLLSMRCSTVQVADGHAEVVDAFVYLGSMVVDWHSSILHELVGKKNLEIKHQAGYQDTRLPDLHSPCLVVWVRDMVHHKAPALSH